MTASRETQVLLDHLDVALSESVYEALRDAIIERETLRRKLAAAPQWRRKPTCAGTWVSSDELSAYAWDDEDVRDDIPSVICDWWYGPIPDAPREANDA